jgi:predicted PhzF superfamily epimerase YddE/YHI9
VLEETIGDVVCSARHRQGRALAAYFELPKLPERLDGKAPSKAEIAAGLGLELADIGFGAHEPSLYSAGAPYLFVPSMRLARAKSSGVVKVGLIRVHCRRKLRHCGGRRGERGRTTIP